MSAVGDDSKVFSERLVAGGLLGADTAAELLSTFHRRGEGRTFPSFLLQEGMLSLDQLVRLTEEDSPVDLEGETRLDDPLIGQELSGCAIERPLGEGGMGAVYQARRLEDGRPVVLKFLAPHLSRDAGLLKRFEREGRVLEKLPEHPNVVRVFGVGQGERPHIVMELVQGLSLERLLDERWNLPPEEATRIVRDVARGLAWVHQHGIIHRDIKPANVVATSDGAVKVLDFGLAKDLAASDLTRPGQRLGTPWYMAPEQWGNHEVDARADVFGLGATYYHLVVGEPPFLGKNPAEVARRIASGDYTPPSRIALNLPRAMELVIAQMLMPERSFRYASMEDCVEDLERVLAGKPPRIPCLIRREGDRPGKGIPLLPGTRFTIGRELECEARIDASSVSRRHAELSREATGFVVRDLGSTFGTFVEGMRVERPVTLKDGDRLRVGEIELKFRDPTRAAAESDSSEEAEPPCAEVPDPLFEALVAAGDARVTLALIAQLAPDRLEEARDERALRAALGDEEGAQLAERARELAARARGRVPGRLFALTGQHLGPKLEAWLSWWEQTRRSAQRQVVPARPAATLRLEVAAGEAAAASLVLTGGDSMWLGRDDSCQLSLSHRSVSRRHAIARRLGSRLLVRDGGSRLGTLVGGARVRAALLSPGDRLHLGDVELEVTVEEGDAPLRGGSGTWLVSPHAFEALIEAGHPAAATGLVGLLREAALEPHPLQQQARALFAGDAGPAQATERALARLLRQRADRSRETLADILGGQPRRYPQTLAERRSTLGPQLLPIGWLAATR